MKTFKEFISERREYSKTAKWTFGDVHSRTPVMVTSGPHKGKTGYPTGFDLRGNYMDIKTPKEELIHIRTNIVERI